MSISDPIKGVPLGTDLPEFRDSTGSVSALAAGMPDPAVLERMARELFGSIAGDSAPIHATTSAGGAPDPASLTHQSQAIVPSESQLRTAAHGAGDPVSLVSAAAPARAGSIPGALPEFSPGVPGGLSASDFSTLPDFGFLREARTLFAVASAVSADASQAASSNGARAGDADPRAHLSSLPTSVSPNQLPVASTVPTDATIPQIPSAPVPAGIPAKYKSYNFHEHLRPLESIDVLPSLSPLEVGSSTSALTQLSSIPFDVAAIRRDFPILQERVNGRPLIWLDNAATTQKPQAVIDRISHFYAHENSNIHRAAHALAARATDAYEAAREKTRRFLNAGTTEEIIFVRGATEGINLVAQSWGRRHIQKGDEIVISHLEHHANIVPWQMLCVEKGARLRVAPVDNTGQVLLDEYEKLFTTKTKLASITHVSNALGTITPVREMIEFAHRYGARVLIDGAQSVSHLRVDVQAYDCDFFVFSGHKVFAPTGIGVVFGKADVLKDTPPWQGGGNMIADVTFEKTVYQPPPGRFEAGTGSIGDAVGLGAAIDYVERIGLHNISRYEHDLLVYATAALQKIPGLHLIGTAREKASVLSFVLDGYRTEDVGAALNMEGIAVRSGHHCAQPILRRFGLESTVRPSLAFYNTCEEIDALVAALWNLKSGQTGRRL